MIEEDLIYEESTLFSKPEQSYLNYYLNSSEYTNGFDLRNVYSHGSPVEVDSDEVHEMRYFMYLKIFILAFLKIDDDLYLYKHLGKDL
jgi:hypothetical protein